MLFVGSDIMPNICDGPFTLQIRFDSLEMARRVGTNDTARVDEFHLIFSSSRTETAATPATALQFLFCNVCVLAAAKTANETQNYTFDAVRNITRTEFIAHIFIQFISFIRSSSVESALEQNSSL